MKVLSKFLLSSVFIVLFATGVAPLFAQTSSQCVDLQKGFDFEVGTQDPQEAIEHLQTRVKKLEACLEAMQFDMSIHDPHLMENQIDDNRKRLNTVESKLYETEERLRKAEVMIEMLDLRLSALEPRKSKPKAPVNKGITIDPRTGERMSVTEWDTQGNPIQSAGATAKPLANKSKAPSSKPKAPVNKPKATINEGTH